MMERCSHQPAQSEWDALNASWWATESDTVSEQVEPMARNDGAWLVRRGCLDCCVTFYADEEWSMLESAPDCPLCGGHRWHCWTLPMDRRMAGFRRHGIDALPFGRVRVDFASELPDPDSGHRASVRTE